MRNLISDAEYRRVLGHLPTGVTVLTAFLPDGTPTGMAANSVTSVSLKPPMILVCPAKSSTTWLSIRDAGRFCVNFLASHHAELCARFAQRGTERFAGVDWHPGAAGPALDDAIGWLQCEILAEHEAGDHTVVIAGVTDIEASPQGSPLVFFKGKFGTFS
ncbi:flavin reductase family protein [Streptomyces sp. DG2A-72]|uniref:flavin reductase family protein n=1 Tax=Streptomyces sp. DG2A-72 TaxID=3051386 RepID=UPI00265C65EC|nr:flavin reductase family protein [Streptomyces sp. DG2A-72]MDO0932251.1 flavin reductase family protein [Streptomyces sp. DG2A-72]